jgi:hypothetical protein
MNMVNYAVKKIMMGKSDKPKLFNSIVAVDKQTVLSSLTGGTSTNDISSSAQTKSSDDATTALLLLKGVTNMTASTNNASSADTVPCQITDSVTSYQEYLDTNFNSNTMAKNIGRAKGSTVAAGISLIQGIELATKEATDWLANNLKKQWSIKKRAEKGLLNEVMKLLRKSTASLTI